MTLKLLFVCCWKSPEGRTTFIPPYGTSTNLRVTSRTKTREVIKMLMTKFQVCLLLFPIFSYVSCFVIYAYQWVRCTNIFLCSDWVPQKVTDGATWAINVQFLLGLIHHVPQEKRTFFCNTQESIRIVIVYFWFTITLVVFSLKKLILISIWDIMAYNLVIFLCLCSFH